MLRGCLIHRLMSVVVLLAAARADAQPSSQDAEADVVRAARGILDAFHAEKPEPATRKLHVIYFAPQDREPAKDWQARTQRVMEHVRDFYAREMKRLGFGERTVTLDFDANKKLVVHLVRGARPFAAYDTKSGNAIRDEARPILKAKGIDIDRETILIFCLLTTYDGKSIRHQSPYYAGGSAKSGTAWLCDSELLDPLSLSKTGPFLLDGEYGKVSLGRYNSIFIGGTAHELGHALGLPHNRENAAERVRGASLMGGGNRTYGQELRKEGPGSFLPVADGLRLAAHPMFSGSQKGLHTPVKAKLVELKFERKERAFRVSGRVESSLPCYAVVAYFDPDGGGDYDAHTAGAVPDSKGRFVLDCLDLVKGRPAELRLLACLVNGATHQQKYRYAVTADGQPNLDDIRLSMDIAPVVAAWKTGDVKKFDAARAALTGGLPANDILVVWSAKLAETLGKSPRHPAPEKIAAQVKDVDLADCAYVRASVGWLQPARHHVPSDDFFLSVAGQRFARGLYAHAPSRHEWQLGGQWDKLRGKVGIQDGNAGSVIFVVRGDGKDLWRSPLVQAGKAIPFDVAVAGVRQLELLVEDGGNGNASDWGLWLEPRLGR